MSIVPSYKVLFIEDDRIDQLSFQNMVRNSKLNYEYDIASSIREAREFLDSKEYDVILTDYMLKDGTAFDLFDVNYGCPFIFITGAGDEETAVSALKAGAYDYIIKDHERNYLKILPHTVANAIKRNEIDKSMAAHEQNLKTFVKHNPAAVAMFDRNLNYLMHSERWLSEFSIDQKDIQGQSLFVIAPDLEEKWQGRIQKCLEGQKIKAEKDNFIAKDGSLRYVKWEIHPWFGRDEKIGGIIMFTEDITAEVFSREKLINQTRELARSNNDLQQFAYVASHDLKEPLRMVGNFVQLLEKRYSERLDKDGKNYIQYAVKGVNRMWELIDDLLNYSSLGKRNEIYERIYLKETLEDIVTHFKNTPSDKRIEIILNNIPEEINAIKGQLDLLFSNLISNSIKFNQNLVARITIDAISEKSKWIFSVTDNGIGIDPGFYEKIFIIFQRLHNKEDYPGTGIGLAICKKIVDLHNGEIWLVSEEGMGSTFHFTVSKSLKSSSISDYNSGFFMKGS